MVHGNYDTLEVCKIQKEGNSQSCLSLNRKFVKNKFFAEMFTSPIPLKSLFSGVFSWRWGALPHQLSPGGRYWLLVCNTLLEFTLLLVIASLCSWTSTSARSRAAGPAGSRSRRWPAPPPDNVLWHDFWWRHSAGQPRELGQAMCTDKDKNMHLFPSWMKASVQMVLFHKSQSSRNRRHKWLPSFPSF